MPVRYRGPRPRTRAITRVTGKAEISSSNMGPITHVINTFDPWLSKKSKREANAIVKAALQTAGIGWIQNDLEKRFTPYAERKLGYNGRVKRKRRASDGASVAFYVDQFAVRDNMPFVHEGTMAMTALTQAQATATATSTRQKVRITIPRGHAVNPKYAGAFINVPAQEVQKIATRVRQALTGLMEKDIRAVRQAERT